MKKTQKNAKKLDFFTLTSPERIIFPKNNITKLDVFNYYNDIAELILPFLKNRPLSIIRCNAGIENKFFKRHATNTKEMVERFLDGDEEYFYIKTKSQLLNQVQMGTIEFHPWGCLYPKINNPDMMIFDLDPDEKLGLKQLQKGVLDLKTILDELNLTAFLKTSGGKGYHIVVPFSNCSNWEIFDNFSENIARVLELKFPNLYTTNIRKAERTGRIFIDYLRNTKGATCVSPHSLRAKESAPISFPIAWENLTKITPNKITIKNYKKYLNNSWKNFNKYPKN